MVQANNACHTFHIIENYVNLSVNCWNSWLSESLIQISAPRADGEAHQSIKLILHTCYGSNSPSSLAAVPVVPCLAGAGKSSSSFCKEFRSVTMSAA